MKDDLIKRSDAIKALCDITNNSDMQEDWHRGISVSISALYRVPSADRPQGEWKQISPAGVYECTNCLTTNIETSRYCPYCGAKMKGADDEADRC